MAILINGGNSVGTPNLPFSTALTPLTIAPAQVFMVPAGPHLIQSGSGYATLEQYDGTIGEWRPAPNPPLQPFPIDSDGANYRIINRTGCPVGAVISNVGSSYTSAPTVTANTGGSKWTAVVGGSLNTSVTVTTGGGYNYVPTLVFPAPPAGGVRASGYCVISGGAISSVVITNAGAGYTTVPTSVAVNNGSLPPTQPNNNLLIIQDPRDTGTGGGVLTINATLANAQKITAVYCTDPGTTAQTTTPTLAFTGGAGGGAAATVLMNYTVTGFTVTDKGSSLGTSTDFLVCSGDYHTTVTTALTDPQMDSAVAFSRQAWLRGFTNSSGNAIASNTSLTTIDAGWGFQQAPSLYVIPNLSTAVVGGFVATTLAATVGGTNDTWYIQRIGV